MNVGVISLGCAKNQVDTENMLGLLKACGHCIVSDPSIADILIVNTCGFILPAKEESINSILEMAQYKKHGRCKTLIATGCLVERYREELIEAIPEVDIFLGVHEYDRLPALLVSTLGKKAERMLLTPPYRAYLRIGDGCNNRCTYCAIPLIRGALSSVPMEKLVDEAKALADGGVTELTLIAQDTSGYGKDIYGKPSLILLLKELDKIDSLRWIRVLYTYPDTVTPELLDTLCSGKRLVPYLDMPLQHINDDILRRMNRRGDKRLICSVLDYLKKNYPQVTLRTTMMVGFPNETQEQFCELMQFLRDYPFDRVGAFAYSSEEGTAACQMDGQIDEQIKKQRLDELMLEQQSISRAQNLMHIGQERLMLIEDIRDGKTFGRTMREAPDADGLVEIPTRIFHAIGDYIPIRLTWGDCYDMRGESI